MSIGQTEWPHLLADLKAKRDALDQVIAAIETHFFPVNGAMPESIVGSHKVRRTNRGKLVRAAKRNERTNEQAAGQRARRSLPNAQEPP